MYSVSNLSGNGNNKWAWGSYILPEEISLNHNVVINCYCYANSYEPTWGGGAGGGYDVLTVSYYL